jgi:anti-anti-sigma regulatory factor
VRLDLSGVEDLDASGLQLLLALRTSLLADDRTLELIGVPETVAGHIASMGCTTLLGGPLTASNELES